MCCHPARRFKIDDMKIDCIDLIEGSTDWIHWDLKRRVMKVSVTGKCGVCGTAITIESEKTIVTGDWNKCVTTR